MPARRYAIYKLTGSYDGIAGAYQRLFEQWLPGSGEDIAAEPCLEHYLNDCMTLPPSEWLTNVCVPLVG